jgi:adenylate cyclase
MAETRKLAAILAADVVGYSRLAGSDEERTLSRLRALRSDLIDPTIAVHHGRVVKRTGDGVLIEFRSVVDAVRCGIEVQNGMVERNIGLPPERRIEFRVGIHVGDVVEESDEDLMGDGVNIAGRLEGIADPGGICLSEDAYRQVRDRIKEGFVDLGEKELKNIARPVRVYALKISLAGKTAAGDTSTSENSGPPRLSIVVLPFDASTRLSTGICIAFGGQASAPRHYARSARKPGGRNDGCRRAPQGAAGVAQKRVRAYPRGNAPATL